MRCREYSGCTHFSFYTSNRECYMKTGDQDKRDNLEVVSGPAVCPGGSTVPSTPTTQAEMETLQIVY